MLFIPQLWYQKVPSWFQTVLHVLWTVTRRDWASEEEWGRVSSYMSLLVLSLEKPPTVIQTQNGATLATGQKQYWHFEFVPHVHLIHSVVFFFFLIVILRLSFVLFVQVIV